MCSIAGAPVGVYSMLQKMKHRSPNGMNIINSDGYEIGMGRLAIVDLSPVPYPFVYKDIILTFNGEIYNYLELKEELTKLGHVFETNSDTEVLAHAFYEWGEDCLDKLNGMFAFAIKQGRKIFLARDIAGEKPLYFSVKPFTFASEAKALKAKKYYELPAAHKMWFDLDAQSFMIRPWWEFKRREIDLDTAEDELSMLLDHSIYLRTRADVPYGLYLSGGVDSTLISTYHNFEHTFTYEDGNYAQEFKRVFPAIVYHLDEPIDSFSPFGLWKLAEQANRKGVKVVLSGEGADELFGGYVRYVPNALNVKAHIEFPSYKNMFPISNQDLGWIDFNGKMKGLLRMGDRMASAWGIENRCPFLDRRIIEFAFSLPPNLRAYGYDTKIILRNILERRKQDYVPQEKHGLYCSVNKWLGENDKLDKTVYMQYQHKLWIKSQ